MQSQVSKSSNGTSSLLSPGDSRKMSDITPVLVCHSRVMKSIGLKLVGRNHYDPESAVIIGKHR